MTKKLMIVGCFFAAIFLPCVVAGFLFELVRQYFVGGMHTAEEGVKWLDEKLGE